MAITSKYKPDINISAQLMKEVGLKEKELIRRDSLKGISQDATGSKFGAYKSEQYKRYKAEWMRHRTTMKGQKRSHNKGTLLKGVSSVISNETAFVNMTLTGKMAEGLHIESVKENEVIMSYLPRDAGKIIGNQVLGRDVVGLNKANVEIVGDMIFQEMSKNIDDWCRSDINIIVNIL
jgi:hypothetical protein